jgi:hypothetical protein
MPRECLNIVDKLNNSRIGGIATDTPIEGDGLASNLTMEWTEDELPLLGWIKNVESSPVNFI